MTVAEAQMTIRNPATRRGKKRCAIGVDIRIPMCIIGVPKPPYLTGRDNDITEPIFPGSKDRSFAEAAAITSFGRDPADS